MLTNLDAQTDMAGKAGGGFAHIIGSVLRAGSRAFLARARDFRADLPKLAGHTKYKKPDPKLHAPASPESLCYMFL